MEKQVLKVIDFYDICTSLPGNNEENHEESNFINTKAKTKNKYIEESAKKPTNQTKTKQKQTLEITEEMTNGVNFSKHSTNKTVLFSRRQWDWKKKQQYITRHGII